MSYDFNPTFTEGFTDTGTLTFSRTNMRILHGEFGPRINIGHHAIQPFVALRAASSISVSMALPPLWALLQQRQRTARRKRHWCPVPRWRTTGPCRTHRGLRLDVGGAPTSSTAPTTICVSLSARFFVSSCAALVPNTLSGFWCRRAPADLLANCRGGLAPPGVSPGAGLTGTEPSAFVHNPIKTPLSGWNPQNWTPQSKTLYRISRMDSPPEILAICHSRGSQAPAKVREKGKLSRFLTAQEGCTGTIFPFPSSNTTYKTTLAPS